MIESGDGSVHLSTWSAMTSMQCNALPPKFVTIMQHNINDDRVGVVVFVNPRVGPRPSRPSGPLVLVHKLLHTA